MDADTVGRTKSKVPRTCGSGDIAIAESNAVVREHGCPSARADRRHTYFLETACGVEKQMILKPQMCGPFSASFVWKGFSFFLRTFVAGNKSNVPLWVSNVCPPILSAGSKIESR